MTGTCTLVDGIGDGTFSPSLAKTVTVPAGIRMDLTWRSDVDNGAAGYTSPAVSCALPASTEIVGVAYQALDEVGT